MLSASCRLAACAGRSTSSKGFQQTPRPSHPVRVARSLITNQHNTSRMREVAPRTGPTLPNSNFPGNLGRRLPAKSPCNLTGPHTPPASWYLSRILVGFRRTSWAAICPPKPEKWGSFCTERSFAGQRHSKHRERVSLPHRSDEMLGREPRSEPRAPMQMVSGALGSLGLRVRSLGFRV